MPCSAVLCSMPNMAGNSCPGARSTVLQLLYSGVTSQKVTPQMETS